MTKRPRDSLQTESVALEILPQFLDVVAAGSLTPEGDPARVGYMAISGSMATCREWNHMIPPKKNLSAYY